MSWEKYAYTSAGAAMLSESISGGALTITRAVSGTGTVDTDLSEETAVSGDTYELKLLGIDTVEYEGEKARKVSIWTGGADKPYFMHQIGVFGRLNDDPEDTLLFLMQDDRGVEIPAIGTADHEFQIAVLLAVSTKANISLTVDPQVEAIMRMVREMVLKEISQHNDAPDAHAKIITEATSKALKELEESGQIMSEDRVKELIKEGGGGGSGGGYYGRYDLALSASGWQEAQDAEGKPYQYIYDAELADSKSTLVPIGAVLADSFHTANDAGILPGCETFDGYVRFYSSSVPEDDVQLTVILFGKGGGNSDLTIATREQLGHVKVGDGIDVTEDGVISSNAKVSQEQIATTGDTSEMLDDIFKS